MFANWARVNEPTSVVHVLECQNFFASNCSRNDIGSRKMPKKSKNPKKTKKKRNNQKNKKKPKQIRKKNKTNQKNQKKQKKTKKKTKYQKKNKKLKQPKKSKKNKKNKTQKNKKKSKKPNKPKEKKQTKKNRKTVTFLDMLKIWVFFGKIDGIFEKKLEFSPKSLNVANLLQNAYPMVLFLKMSSALFMMFFGKIIRKLGTVEKLETMMKKDCFFEKKSFHFFKSLFFKNGKAQNMPLLAGRLVILPIERFRI